MVLYIASVAKAADRETVPLDMIANLRLVVVSHDDKWLKLTFIQKRRPLGLRGIRQCKNNIFYTTMRQREKINMLLKVLGSAYCIREVATRLSTKTFNFLRNFDNKINYSTINCKIKY